MLLYSKLEKIPRIFQQVSSGLPHQGDERLLREYDALCHLQTRQLFGSFGGRCSSHTQIDLVICKSMSFEFLI